MHTALLVIPACVACCIPFLQGSITIVDFLRTSVCLLRVRLANNPQTVVPPGWRMAGASVQNMASKLPQWVLPAVLWSMLCKVLGIASYKLMQVLVGTGFLVLLNVLAAISFVQRVVATPQLLHKVKRRRLEPVQLIEASLTVADTAQIDGSGCGDKSSSKPPIIIRAVASTADTVKPVILHNEPGKGELRAVDERAPLASARLGHCPHKANNQSKTVTHACPSARYPARFNNLMSQW